MFWNFFDSSHDRRQGREAMGLDEQKEEREVLESIFPDEITGPCPRPISTGTHLTLLTDISETSFRVSITLDVQDASDPPSEPPTILLNITYPDSYPDVGPHLDITTPPNAPKQPLLNIADDKPQLLESLEPVIEESLGMAMIFTLVTTLKDSAEQLIAERQKAEEEIAEGVKRKAEEEENRKFHGTAVTKDSFLNWRAEFRMEMERKQRQRREEEEMEDKKRRGGKEEKKLTGRQLWEKGLVGRGEEEELEGEDALDGVTKLRVG